jgi:hypothetical protein
MITVSILINGQPIFTRSAVNRGESAEHPELTRYEVDDGSWLLHKRSDGAVPLAIQMLETIKEQN